MSSAKNLGSGVRMIGDAGWEGPGISDPLLPIVQGASDRSASSDELAGHISDWATRYHFSRLRANILLPISIPPGARVLDLGCESGALTRSLAERGVRVTGLEPDPAMARLAGSRCAGLANCDIACGSLSDYIHEEHEGEFDCVLMFGSLAKVASLLPQGDPGDVLRAVRGLLKPDGVVVLIAENQVGLKYLLGYPEPTRRVPWVGIDGYRTQAGARSWSGRQVSRVLRSTGLSQQEWIYAYPDAVHPTTLVRQEVFESAEGGDLLRLFVRNPVEDYESGSMLVADPVAAFQTMLDSGIGAQTANAFLVVAGAPDSDPQSWVREGRIWVSSSERAAELMDRRAVVHGPDGWRMRPLDGRDEVHIPPLVSHRIDSAVILGSSLEDEIVAQAARARMPSDLSGLLNEWWQAAKPWLDQEGDGYHVDVMPRNFVRSGDGDLHYVDREWIWTDDVPRSWAMLRSLWFLVLKRLWPSGATAGLSWNLTVGEVVLALARLIDGATVMKDLEESIGYESQLQARVLRTSAQVELHRLRGLLETPLKLLAQGPPLAQILERPLIVEAQAEETLVQAQLLELQATDEVIGHRAELESLRRQVKVLQEKVNWLQSRRAVAQVAKARRAGGRVKRRMLG